MKIKDFFKYFWIIPTDIQGGFRFQINIPIGRLKKKGKENRHDNLGNNKKDF